MKNISTLLSILALVLVGVLFYLHFDSKKAGVIQQNKLPGTDSSSAAGAFRIAYFEMDSIQENCELVKDLKKELSKKEEGISAEISRMEKAYRDKFNEYQSKGTTMNQVQSEAAQKDLMQTQQGMQSKKQQLDNEYQEYYMRRMRSVKEKIQDYLKDYNKSKGYSYIITDEPGLLYYRDTIYNITPDVIVGLNQLYKKKD